MLFYLPYLISICVSLKWLVVYNFFSQDTQDQPQSWVKVNSGLRCSTISQIIPINFQIEQL